MAIKLSSGNEIFRNIENHLTFWYKILINAM